MRRVLVAFCVRSPEIGYCQSMNCVAGTLLTVMEEEDAFWMFVSLVKHVRSLSVSQPVQNHTHACRQHTRTHTHTHTHLLHLTRY